MERVTLEMSREQAMIVERACETFARLKLGQFNIIYEQMIGFSLEKKDRYFSQRDDIRDALDLVAKMMFGRDLYGQPDVLKDDEFGRAWETYTALRYTRCCHDYPEEVGKSWSVCFDKPMSESGDGVPKCEIREVET